jgi:hypothetical protein
MNSALIKLGAERIISEDDESVRARLMKEQYPKLRDALMRSHPWKFARGRASLALIDPIPTTFSGWDFQYVFQLPADCLRVIETNLCNDEEWSVENPYLACNSSEVLIKYIKKITDVTKFDDNFCEVLAWYMAADVAYALTQSTAREQAANAGFEEALMTARSFNAQQGSVQRVISDDWLTARR